MLPQLELLLPQLQLPSTPPLPLLSGASMLLPQPPLLPLTAADLRNHCLRDDVQLPLLPPLLLPQISRTALLRNATAPPLLLPQISRTTA